MGHNVSKKSSKTKTTEINSVSIRQSLANGGDVEIAEHGTLSGKPESRRPVFRSDLSTSIRRSLKPAARSKSKQRTANTGAHTDDRVQLTASSAYEEPDLTSSPVAGPGSRDRDRVRDNHRAPAGDSPPVMREEETRKSKRKKNPHRPYRSDSVQAMKPELDNIHRRERQNGYREMEVAERTPVANFNNEENGGKSTAGESEIDEERCNFQRFEKQRSTTRRKSKKKMKQKSNGDPSSMARISRLINGDDPSNNGHSESGGVPADQNEAQSQSMFVSPTKLYNILNDGGPAALREIDKRHLVLFDTRSTDDYERAHIIGAKHILRNQSDLGVDLSVPYSWIVLYDDDGHSHFTSQSVLTSTLDRLSYLGHRATILQAGFQCFVSKYAFMCQTDESIISSELPHYPSEVIRNRLYLGTFNQAQTATVITNLEIVYVLNISSEMVKPVTGQGRVMNLQFRENSKNDLLQVMPQVLSVISSALEEKGAKILVTCSSGNNKSAAVIALYLMHKKKWPMEKAMKFITSSRESVELSDGVCEQLQRCEKFVFQAY